MEADTNSALQQTVAAIIPAYDERPRVINVARTARDSGLFTEVIVVDDGSRDGTGEAVEAEPGLRLCRHERNQGKSQAMKTGLEACSAPLVCFLDADLLNVTAEHLAQLVDPVSSGDCRASLAVFSGGRTLTSLAQKISPLISGQRCLQRELLDSFSGWGSRFGVETAINEHLGDIGVQQRIVTWHGAAQVMKEEKRGCFGGFLARLGMYRDIMLARARHRRH